MKNKTKLMLALSILTAGTLAAGATGTFAWFTTNKTATATYNKITVQGTQGNLGISIKGVTESTKTSGDEKPDATITDANGLISDVSSQDGLVFTQPDWFGVASNESATRINGVKNVTTSKGYFVQYLVTISNKSANDTGNVSGDTTVKVSLTSVEITSDTANAKKWARVAINKNVKASSDTGDTYLVEDTAQGKASLIAFFQEDTSDGVKYVKENPAKAEGNDNLTIGDALTDCATAPTKTSETKADEFVTLTNKESITLGVSVWLEGTLANKQDSAKGESFGVKLTFTAK